jgi:hypothetical protein
MPQALRQVHHVATRASSDVTAQNDSRSSAVEGVGDRQASLPPRVRVPIEEIEDPGSCCRRAVRDGDPQSRKGTDGSLVSGGDGGYATPGGLPKLTVAGAQTGQSGACGEP